MSLAQRPLPESTNNDVLSGRGSMPNKSLYSVNESRFSMGRVLYTKTINTLVQNTPSTVQEKKFYGGMRNSDASSVMERKKYLAQGRKPVDDKLVSFQGKSANSESQRALGRVRNQGAIVPPKKTGRVSLF
jgi:hypothetical protein